MNPIPITFAFIMGGIAYMGQLGPCPKDAPYSCVPYRTATVLGWPLFTIWDAIKQSADARR